jgi:hypothetical protein
MRNVNILVALLALLGGYLIWMAVEQAQLVSPTPETESAFLKTYTPRNVIERFKRAQYSQMSSGTSGAADRGFATHQSEFEPTFVIDPKDWVALEQALRDDIISRLTDAGAEIVADSGDAVNGFQIRYALGKSQGAVAVEPVKMVPPANLAIQETGPDKITVSLHLRIYEKWYRAKNQEVRGLSSRNLGTTSRTAAMENASLTPLR